MAIARDATSFQNTNSATSLSWSHTCTGSDLILWVGVMHSSGRTISSVTYNGVGLTSLTRSAGSQVCQLWYLVNPATGSNTIQVNLTGGNSFMYCCAASYTGVAQTGQPDAQNTNSATSTSVTTTITTIADNCWTILLARNADAGDTSAGAGALEIVTNAGFSQLYDSNGAITPAGSYSMTVNNAGSHITTTAMASFSPAGGGGGGTSSLSMLLLGVGA